MASVRSNRVVLPEGVRPASLEFEDGVLVAIDDGVADIDYGDLVVLPGLVDSHVHVNEPGRTDWEGFETATRSAAAGGTTTLVDMPLNSIPPTVTVEALEVKRKAARGKLVVDTAFWGGLIPGSESQLTALVGEGVCGFKSFMVDSGVAEFPPMDIDELTGMAALLSELGVPLIVHAEDPASLQSVEGDPRSYQSYLLSRPESGELSAVVRAEAIAASTGAAIHVLHVSSAEAAEAIGNGPANLTGETCPHYLVFCAEEVPEGATEFKCAPPIRGASHRDALWAALEEGSLSMIVSDHSPAPASIKETESGDFERAWGGVGSLQLRLQAVWTHAEKRGIGWNSLARWLSMEPARLAGLAKHKGSLEVGKDADFVVFDPDASYKVHGPDLQHRHPVTPYQGMVLSGAVVSTVLRGQTVFEDGSFFGGQGRMLRRDD